MILARIAVYGAILCTLWFNGSYAWSKGGALHHQLSMVALAITIDLCKCGFLPAASRLWQTKWRLAACALTILWLPALAYSTFAGFAAITTNRTATTDRSQTMSDTHSRAKADYQRLSEALSTAQSSSLWQRSSACTNPRYRRDRAFCDEVGKMTEELSNASAELADRVQVSVDPEISVLVDTVNWPEPSVALVIALWPAILIELVASLGLYAVHRPTLPQAPGKPSESLSDADPLPTPPASHQTTPRGVQSPSREVTHMGDTRVPAAMPVLTWPR